MTSKEYPKHIPYLHTRPHLYSNSFFVEYDSNTSYSVESTLKSPSRLQMSAFSQAAPPLLGSNLLVSAQVHESAGPLPANSGSATIDQNALEGGFRYGEITSIAGASGTGKTLVGTRSLMLIAEGIQKIQRIDSEFVQLCLFSPSRQTPQSSLPNVN